ncbi:MAG TPA: HNH endonuclease signature motif containing protein [Opitutaceae bacterium]|nr:HNH endonuclease signature motif containing protein [Opitutaceae bacterium]
MDYAYLRECFEYDPETGMLTWRDRPRSHFRAPNAYATFRNNFADKPAGSLAPHGYVTVRLNRKLLYAHRIAWVLMTGVWPLVNIDHVNGDKADNRWANLRLATQSQNMTNVRVNAGHFRRKYDLPRGVSMDIRFPNRPYIAQYRKRYLGCYATPEEAHAAYLAAAGQYAHAV